MVHVTVRSLFGETWHTDIEPGATVSQLKQRLRVQDGRLGNAVLSFQFKNLEDTQVIGDLGLAGGSFMTAMIRRGKKQKAVGNCPTPNCPADEASQAPVAEGSSAVKEQPHGIGSLEEGYNCRPGASPLLARRRMPEPAREDGAVGRKLPVSGSPSEDPGTPGPIINPVNDLSDREQPGAEKQGPRAPPTAEDDLFEELQAELIGAESAPNPTGSSTPGSARDHEAGSISQRRRSGRLGRAGKALGPERTEALPLPEPLDRLNRVFAALNTIYGFMLSNQIQATWQNTRKAIQDLTSRNGCRDTVEVQDLKVMEELAPDVLVLRDWCMLKPFSTPEAGDGAEGTGSDSQCGEWKQSFVIELTEPGRPAPQQDVSSYHQVVGGGSTDLGLDAAGLGTVGCYGPRASGGGQRHRSNASKRRAAAFRRRLVLAAVAALRRQGHEDQLKGMLAENAETGNASMAWPAGCPWADVTLEEVLEAARSAKSGEGDPQLMAARARQGSHDSAVPRPPKSSKPRCCTETTDLDAAAFLEHLQALPGYMSQICHVESIKGKTARLATPSASLSRQSKRALAARGLQKLFTHQAAAIDAALNGRHVVVSASTASGKSLCYNVPIMEAVAAEPQACAIYMFPTKALAQDQLRALRTLVQDGFGPAAPRVDVYDGDTPMDARGDIRAMAQLLITNPDMLHCSVLPVHSQFARLLGHLRYIVIDEGHYYTGVFGAHTALVLRRLRRVCETCYNSSPQFIVTSATMANPKSHAQELLGVSDVLVVDDDGSPHGSKSFVLWNPPLQFDESATTDQKNPAKRIRQKASRDKRRTANQVRGSGSQLGRLGNGEQGTAEWLAVCKLGRKRQNDYDGSADDERASNTIPARPPTANRAEVAGDDAIVDSEARDDAGGAADRRRHLLRLEAEAAIHATVATETCHSGWMWRRQRMRGSVAATAPSAAKPGSAHKRGVLYKAAAGRAAVSQGEKDAILARMDQRAQPIMTAGGREGAAPEVQYGAAGTRASEWRKSPMVELATLLAEAVQHNIRTLAFCMTRKLCELVTSYTREILRLHHPELAGLVAVYRSGYSATERREIERKLHDGELRAVCATNAMELGLDIGDLDATMHLGFAGSIASLWQQAGRAGRRGQHSLAIYVAFDGPLDQYFMMHPQALFGRAIEQTTVDANNFQLLQPHIVCAAAEAPLRLEWDDVYFGSGMRDCARLAVEAGSLSLHPQAAQASRDVLHYTSKENNYASTISIRAIDPNRIRIVNEEGDVVMEEVEECKAFYQIYPGAIYYHQGKSYLCKNLDLGKRLAIVRPADVKYYTKVADFTDVHVVGGGVAYPVTTNLEDCPFTTATVGNATVTTRYFAFHRVWKATGILFDTVPLHLPDMAYDTQAVYIRVPPSARKCCREANLPFRDGVHAACHAILNVLPLYLTCSTADMGTECDNPYDTRYRPERLLIYDKHPGGIGLAQQLHPLMGVLIQRALELVEQCPCESDHGCPSCVQHTGCGEYNTVLHKDSGRIVLMHVLKHEVVFGEPSDVKVKPEEGGTHGT